ncbi:major capsid protein [Dipodfec virus UOA04_Rod_626]|nr:major capsid protein [Dipodfec virus UOA04_Rod_626]
MANPSTPVVENNLPGSTNFNLSTAHATTMGTTTVTPLYVKAVLPADKWRIKPALRVHTLPLATSLMGTFTFRVAWFFEPDSNLYGFLDNNDAVTGAQLQNMVFHKISFATPTSSTTGGIAISPNYKFDYCDIKCRVGYGSLLNYLYAPVGFDSHSIFSASGDNYAPSTFQFLADRWLGFWDIYRNYYVNRQVDSFPYFTNMVNSLGNHPTEAANPARIAACPVEALDLLLKEARLSDSDSDLNNLSVSVLGKLPLGGSGVSFIAFCRSNFNFLYDTNALPSPPALSGSYQQEPSAGLPLSCLRADVFTRMIRADSTSSKVFARVQSFGSSINGVTVESLISANNMFNFANNIDISGGRVSDWMRFRWGVDIKDTFNRPVCLGVDSVTLSVDDLRTTASTEGQSAASQVGYIDIGKYLQKISFNNKTGVGGNLFCICTIVPNVYYSQGIEPEVTFTKFLDKYNPEFANENFVNIPRWQLCALPDFAVSKDSDGNTTVDRYYDEDNHVSLFSSVGRTTSWWMYQTDVNRSYSQLSQGAPLEGWVLNRNFFKEQRIYNSTPTGVYAFSNSPYGFPDEFNSCFSDTTPSAQNFIVQFAADINVRRVMPSYNQPKLK